MAPLATVTRDPRTSKALELAAGAGQWLRLTDRATGRRAYGIRGYMVTRETCTCPDSRHRGTVCKHRLAVALVCEAAAAVEANTRRLDQAAELKAASRHYEALMADHFGEEG